MPCAPGAADLNVLAAFRRAHRDERSVINANMDLAHRLDGASEFHSASAAGTT
ncbi:hypothetical protein Kim5_PC00503 (plasmid) [Rhizobium sp. Kim5]|nr:hypothetical protein Kim5_PC00503 [Rhizobium sp. Kim5]